MDKKSLWTICLAALIGFVVGAAVTHPQSAKAQANTNRRPTTIYKIESKRASSNPYLMGTVVGFSCVHKGKDDDEDVDCYIVSQ